MTSRRTIGLIIAVVALAAAAMLSLALGTKSIPAGTILDALRPGALPGPGQAEDFQIVRDLRVPRTVLGLVAGLALGLAGGVMQALTRNPLADPGILGINAGAAAAVVLAIRFLGVGSVTGYIWFAFGGAAAAFTVVYFLGTRGRSGASPQRLALAGAAVGAALLSVTNAVALLDVSTFDRYRLWVVGSLAGGDLDVAASAGWFVAAGALLALALGRPLNALALGADSAQALGAHVGRTRLLTAVAITVLCGAATAAIGPVAFLGLAVPHAARAFVGPDQRWLLPYCAVLAPVVLLVADVVGRLVVRPGELEAGLVTALIGAPVFLAIVLRRRIGHL
ncbi:iron chelate uptake ABC transporter family permease subunit [Spirilliplanes yamanashiensis]|uniref:Iron ABC transporter permease n=2 Tax=Spirilliplanes yamanashiensis TaxID=42233 RepID=A0A8J3Y9B1_9ACTN|nr:iron chelate uptake ABC transporter family permease subunit [Spirilliplanes yamanashiensis]MDP9815621.1 iron complex transport system permease protein [Spirilliplanes yamanashiensis]GIJ03875.1 iron ABC transporter permease [Spirilliplanes yamanashiensis]